MSNVIPINKDTRSHIVVDTDEARITCDTIIALEKRGFVYQRAGKIVEPRLVAVTPGEALGHEANQYQIVEAKPARVRYLVSECCKFTKMGKKGKAVDANVPDYLPAMIIASPLPFPVLSSIAEAPTLRPDGSLLSQPGYDEATGIYLASSSITVDVPEAPTLADAQASGAILLDVIHDFPVSEAGKSVWVSGVLSTACRGAINGPVPMHIIDATTRGAGKSKYVDAANIITTGRAAPRNSYPERDEEMDKRIAAIALAGNTTVLLDNVIGELGCASLDAALTSTSYQGRVLGKLELTSALPMRAVWWATGNGMTVKADLARRSIIARLEPGCDHPEEREGPRPGVKWRHPDLLGYVRDQRARLLSAALTVVRAYIVAGRPQQNLKAMDFDAWSNLIRSAIVWMGLADPGATVKEVRETDAQADAFELMMECWPGKPGEYLTVAKLLECAATDISWRNAVIQWCTPENGRELPSLRRLGNHLRAIKGAIVNDRKLVSDKKTMHGMTWGQVRGDGTPAPPAASLL